MHIAFILSGILVLINFWAIGLLESRRRPKGTTKVVEKQSFPYFISFAGGVTLTYIFLDLFPRVVNSSVTDAKWLLLVVLGGFFFFHLTEKYLYKSLPREDFKKGYRIFHLSILSAYKFTEGIVLYELAALQRLEAFLFFIPLLSLSLNEDFSLHNFHGKNERPLKVVASITVLLGVSIASVFTFPKLSVDTIIAFVTGALIYLAIINLAPREKGGRLYALLGGVLLYVLLFSIFKL